jgi:hypothetical protein
VVEADVTDGPCRPERLALLYFHPGAPRSGGRLLPALTRARFLVMDDVPNPLRWHSPLSTVRTWAGRAAGLRRPKRVW